MFVGTGWGWGGLEYQYILALENNIFSILLEIKYILNQTILKFLLPELQNFLVPDLR